MRLHPTRVDDGDGADVFHGPQRFETHFVFSLDDHVRHHGGADDDDDDDAAVDVDVDDSDDDDDDDSDDDDDRRDDDADGSACPSSAGSAREC